MLIPDRERDQMLGSMAVKTGFCDTHQLAAAQLEWTANKTISLGVILVRRRVLSEVVKNMLERLVDEQLKQQGVEPVTETADASPQAVPEPAATEDRGPHGGTPLDQLTPTLSIDDRHPAHTALGGTESARTGGTGRFCVLGLHQKGGLGQVMLAEDRELPRQVALKEIQPKFADDPISRERFILEAEITGGLEHPGIVPVYGLGKHPNGRPYYAMRFIRGDDLSTAIETFHMQAGGWDPGKRALELQRLLRRFIDVCNAVQYAHSRGVLHRDLKPGNVMLGKYGETLVVDWGLAKIVGRPDTERSGDETTLRISSGSDSHPTLHGSAIGTPGYMSPEQAAGQIEHLGPASDVYSLGATLYCVLTGQSPFKGKDRILERVKSGDFPAPRTVQPMAPRPLEAICLKAMRLAPEQRYTSPRELVDDLERWLADEPVSVYRGTWSERAARWARRHRAWVQAGAASLAMVAAISAVAALVVFQAWKREATAWNAAATNFVQARESVDRWVTGVGEALAYYPVASRTRIVLLEQAAEEYERFVRTQPEDVELEVERGRTYLRLGHLRRLLRDATRATEAYLQAAAVFDAVSDRYPDRVDGLMERANCDTDLGVIAMETNRPAEAEEYLLAAIDRLQQLAQDHPEQMPIQDALAAALVNRGEWLAETGRTKEAEQVLRKALEWLDEHRRASETITPPIMAERGSTERQEGQRMRRAADAQLLLGRVLLEQGRYDAALSELNASVRLTTRLVRREPDYPPYLETRAAAHLYLAVALRELGRTDEEEEAYRQAIEMYRALCAALPELAQFEESLAISLLDRGSLLYQLGRVREAESELNEARAIAERLKQAHPAFARYRDTWAACLDRLAELLRDRGEFERSETMLREAIRTYEELVSEVIVDAQDSDQIERVIYLRSLALCLSHLAQTLQQLGRLSEADEAFAVAIEVLTPLATNAPLVQDRLATIHQHRGLLLHELGHSEEAAAAFRDALTIWMPLAAPEHRAHRAWLLVNCPLVELQDPQEAVRLAQQLTREVPGSADYHNLLGAARVRTGDWPGAVESLRQANRLREREHARDALFLAMALAKMDRSDEAHEAYRRAETWLERNLPHHAELRRIQREAAQWLEMIDDLNKADERG